MQLSNIALAYLVLETKKTLEGAIVRKVQELENNSGFKLKLQSKEGTKDLVVGKGFFFLTNHRLPVTEKPSNFAQRLKKHLLNKKILEISQHGFERIVIIKFEGKSLALELFHNGNVVLLDENNVVIDALELQEFKDREIRKKQAYAFPPSRGISPLELSSEQIMAAFKKSEKDSLRALFELANIAPEIAEEIFVLTKIPKETPAKKISEKQAQAICMKAKVLYTVDAAKYAPVAVKENIFPFMLKSKPEAEKTGPITVFLDDEFSGRLGETLAGTTENQINQEKKKLEFLKNEQETAQKRLEEIAETSAKKAELIYANYSELGNMLSAVRSMEKQGKNGAEIMKELEKLFGERVARMVTAIDVKKKEVTLEL